MENQSTNRTILINLFGGPGVGKSTKAAKVYTYLKEQGYNCELAAEYAKDMVWQESLHVLKNQIYIFGKQHHRLWRLDGKVDVIVTDSPLLLGFVYGHDSQNFRDLVLEEHHKFNNMNIVLNREHEFQQVGRNQNEEEAIAIDRQIDNILEDNQIKNHKFPNITTMLFFIKAYIDLELSKSK